MAFLARLTAIRAGITAGELLSDIYTEHAEQLGIGYTQFTRYVNRHIWKKEKKPRVANASAPAAENLRHIAPPMAPSHPDPPRKRDGPIIPGTREPRKFQFDPTAVLRRKDELF